MMVLTLKSCANKTTENMIKQSIDQNNMLKKLMERLFGFGLNFRRKSTRKEQYCELQINDDISFYKLLDLAAHIGN